MNKPESRTIQAWASYIEDLENENKQLQKTNLYLNTCLNTTINELHQIKYDPIIESVREKFLSRSNVGLKKYGVGLDREDLTEREWLIHLQEELMDATGYIEVLLDKLKKRK